MIYTVSDKGVETLQRLGSSLPVLCDEIRVRARVMMDIAQEQQALLGVHVQDLISALEDILEEQQAAEELIEELSEKALDIADAYQEVIDHIRFTGGAGDAGGKAENNAGTGSDNISDSYYQAVAELTRLGVNKIPIQPAGVSRTTDQIIRSLGGGDMTAGSCSSLAFAYAANKAGYNVLDFRGGESREFFADNNSIKMISELNGVQSQIVYGKNDIICANDLLGQMQPGKEYYFATGVHAAIVRKNGDGYQYLELQSSNDNGWHELNNTGLTNRFGCESMNDEDYPNFLIDIESLGKSREFLDLIGYINTAESDQVKGVSGYAK